MANSDYLMHYGVPGMHWGIRRYQPYSQTGPRKSGEPGIYVGEAKKISKRDLKELHKHLRVERETEDEVKEREDNKKKAGVIVGKTHDTIKKGSELERLANDEPVDEKRKYMSITNRDRRSYSEMFDMLPIDFDRPIYTDNYKANRNLKVATEKMVDEYLKNKLKDIPLKDLVEEEQIGKSAMKRYGDIKISEFYGNQHDTLQYVNYKKNGYEVLDTGNRHYANSKYVGKRSYDLFRSMVAGQNAVRHYFEHDEKLNSETMEHFKKLGMDAMVDIMDSGGFDYPLIILNPKDSVKRTSHYEW